MAVKVWITRYALSQGILEMDAEETHNPDMISVGQNVSRRFFHGKGKEWHTTIDDARARADFMRLRKIDELTSRLNKMKKLSF